MKLADLDPEFVTTVGVTAKGNFRRVDSLTEAQGIMHECPQCRRHQCIEWSRERGADPEQSPLPGRWRIEGTGFSDLTLNAEPPNANRSVRLTGEGCNAHFHISNGEVDLCDDSK